MRNTVLLYLLFFALGLAAQPQLTYYLPDIDYDPAIPTPESVLGYQVGEWHLSHDQLLNYMRVLAEASPRIELTEYARSYENRPLVYLTITSEENHRRLEDIREAHLTLAGPNPPGNTVMEEMPVVLYQGFSIHGNEASGGNAAPLVAYYLAAGRSPRVTKTLEEAVVLLDPCFNPDGFNRFSSWVNMHKNANLTDDAQDREYHEAWPGGRTNHYWFDLNRDWLPLQHPESQGRIRTFHQWNPNVLTDHHEMGSNSTFFFMPGIPSRTNPLTPSKNQELTARIGTYHAEALNEIGSLYYTEESFDDFYYGKGSTYPDANGCIGILFEQASARGHLQSTENGALSFPFAIRNQVRTALSTQKAAVEMRTDLLGFQREFFRSALEEAAADERKAFVFGDVYGPARTAELLTVLRRHGIDVYHLAEGVEADGHQFEPGDAYLVPMEQKQYRLIRAVFETTTTFQDSIFYDVSSWTLPLAFDIPYAALNKKAFGKSLQGEPVEGLGPALAAKRPEFSNYGYLMEWAHYYAPRALNFLMRQGLRTRVATRPFGMDGLDFEQGTLFIPVQNQSKSPAQIHELMGRATELAGVRIHPVQTGLTNTGIDLGSPSFEPLQLPRVLLLVGEGVSAYEAGEAWHLLDHRYGMPITQIELQDLPRRKLDKYNTIVMVNGSYRSLPAAGWEKLREWVREGGTLISVGSSIRQVSQNGLANVKIRSKEKESEKPVPRRPYEMLQADQGAQTIGGAILQAEIDRSHPLFYGFHRSTLAAFQRGTLVLGLSRNRYATPAIYPEEPLISGYINKENLPLLSASAAVIASGYGNGRTICLADNPNFRAFWYGTNRLFANSIFFGRIIDRDALEMASGKPAEKVD